MTELDTDEVIMNSAIVAAENSDDSEMRIQVVGGTTNAQLEKVPPGKVALQVLTTNAATNADYQYVLDVMDGRAHFETGSCENKRRVAGRGKEIVELVLPEGETVVLTAGWAAGHEAVRLTPVLNVQAVSDDAEPRQVKEEIQEEKGVPERKEEPPQIEQKIQKLEKKAPGPTKETNPEINRESELDRFNKQAGEIILNAQKMKAVYKEQVHAGHHGPDEDEDPGEALKAAIKEQVKRAAVAGMELHGNEDESPPVRLDRQQQIHAKERHKERRDEELSKRSESKERKMREVYSDDGPQATFGSYFVGMFILVGANFAAIKIFLSLSRRQKGL